MGDVIPFKPKPKKIEINVADIENVSDLPPDLTAKIERVRQSLIKLNGAMQVLKQQNQELKNESKD